MNLNWRAINPAVPKRWLLGTAGLLWWSVGGMLCVQAAAWLYRAEQAPTLSLVGLGLGLGGLAHVFLFSRIARKNIQRIHAYPERACLFGFQQWQGYLTVAVMITLGVLLRGSSLPRPWLAVAYLAVGTALLLSGTLLGEKFLQLRSHPR